MRQGDGFRDSQYGKTSCVMLTSITRTMDTKTKGAARRTKMSVMKAIDADRDPGPLQIVRLYSKDGEHKLSLLPCGLRENGDVACWDLADPDGKVDYCGIDNELIDVLVRHLGWEDTKECNP